MRTETQREDGVARRLRAPHAHLAAVRSRNPHFSPSYSSACAGDLPPGRSHLYRCPRSLHQWQGTSEGPGPLDGGSSAGVAGRSTVRRTPDVRARRAGACPLPGPTASALCRLISGALPKPARCLSARGEESLASRCAPQTACLTPQPMILH